MDMHLSVDRFRIPVAARPWLVYALFLVAGIAQAAIVPLLPRLSSRFALSTTETALLLALPGLATLAVSVPAGLAADRFGARRVTLMAGLLLGLSSLAQAAPSLALLLAGRVAFGIGFGVVWTTGMAWLSDLDTGEGRSLGPAVTCSSVGIMVGPAVGGMLAEFAGVSAAFVAVAAIATLVLVPLSAVPDGRPRPEPDRDAAGEPEPDGDAAGEPEPDGDAAGEPEPADASARLPRPATPMAGTLSTLRLLRRPSVGAAAGALIVSGAVSGVSQLLISSGLHHLGMSTGRIGLAFSAAALCYIAASTAVVRLGRRAHTLRFNAGATTLLAVALLPAASGVGAVGLIGALLLSAAPRAAVSTIAYSLASTGDSAPALPAGGSGEGMAGRDSGSGEGAAGRDGVVFGLLNGAWAAAMVLMPLVAGAMEQHDGARAGYLAVILPSCLVAACLLARSGAGGPVEAGLGGVGRLRETAARGGRIHINRLIPRPDVNRLIPRPDVNRLIPRPDRSHGVRLAWRWSGRVANSGAMGVTALAVKMGRMEGVRPGQPSAEHGHRTTPSRLDWQVRRDRTAPPRYRGAPRGARRI